MLNWISDAIAEGTVFPTSKRHHGSAEAVAQLIQENVYLAPENLLPHPDDAEMFSAFFGTFLTSTFDVVEHPGTRGVGSANGCGCPICVRLVSAPHLKPKKLYARDKRRAKELTADYLLMLCDENGLLVAEERIRGIVESATYRRDAALVTYCHWLVRRLTGDCDGPAVLSLWRTISRSEKGGLLRDFELTVEEHRRAESRVLSKLREIAK